MWRTQNSVWLWLKVVRLDGIFFSVFSPSVFLAHPWYFSLCLLCFELPYSELSVKA